ncbi:MAG: DNA repair protein RecO C-terminal domain-containing protein [Pseudomonadota bacterium]|nr:DNA repair protein RecO C-terminal domain-containing protein [Pseudomonadota bacterium]
MRQQLLHGYVLHQRAYRENSKLTHFFSLEYGRIDGVARQKLPPLYQPTLVYASGKTSLKSFAKAESAGKPHQLSGQTLFAGFYLNELLVRLLPLEEPCPDLFAAYADALHELGLLDITSTIQQAVLPILRRFEAVLLTTLGYPVRFDQDVYQHPIMAEQQYQFELGAGFVAADRGEQGAVLLLMQTEQAFSAATLPMLTRVFRRVLAEQLGEQPLRSRDLWRAGQNPSFSS